MKRSRALVWVAVLAAACPIVGAAQRASTSPHRAGGSAAAPGAGPVQPAATLAIAAALRQLRAKDADPDKLLGSMVAPGSAAIEPLLTVLTDGRVLEVKPDDEPQVLSVPQRKLVLGALARMPASEVRVAVEGRLLASETPQVRLAAVHVLGMVGTAADFARLDKLLPREPDGDLSRTARETLRQAYVNHLVRDTRVFVRVAEVVSRAEPAILHELLFALAESRDPRALGVYFGVARTMPAMAQTAVALVPRLARSNDAELETKFAAWLRAQVDPRRSEWTRAVHTALAELDEGEAIPMWIQALEGEDRVQRECALAGLRKLSGLTLPAEVGRWKLWFDQELAWFGAGREQDRQRLASHDPAVVVAALRAYSDHRVFRNVLAEDLLLVLMRPHPELRSMTCRTLARIGSRAAVPALVPLLEDSDAGVAREARAALTAILGCELPQENTALRARLSLDS